MSKSDLPPPGEQAELVRRLTDAVDRQDLEAVLGVVDPEIEFVSLIASVGGRVYHGAAGVQDWFDDINEAWSSVSRTIDRVIDAGDRLVVLYRLRSVGRESGVELETPIGAVWELREGKVLRVESYGDPAKALRTAGVERPDAAA